MSRLLIFTFLNLKHSLIFSLGCLSGNFGLLLLHVQQFFVDNGQSFSLGLLVLYRVVKTLDLSEAHVSLLFFLLLDALLAQMQMLISHNRRFEVGIQLPVLRSVLANVRGICLTRVRCLPRVSCRRLECWLDSLAELNIFQELNWLD